MQENEFEKLNKKLEKLCDEHSTSKDGIETLINYYTSSLGWSKQDAIIYTIKLFEDGVIDEIKIIGGSNGKKNS